MGCGLSWSPFSIVAGLDPESGFFWSFCLHSRLALAQDVGFGIQIVRLDRTGPYFRRTQLKLVFFLFYINEVNWNWINQSLKGILGPQCSSLLFENLPGHVLFCFVTFIFQQVPARWKEFLTASIVMYQKASKLGNVLPCSVFTLGIMERHNFSHYRFLSIHLF